MVKLFISLITIAFIFGYVNANSKNQNKNQETAFMSDMEKTPESTVAIIKTNMGTIEVELFEKETPKTVENFTGLAKKGYYNGIIFHRVIDKFMIQGGDPTGTGGGGESLWGGEFKDEIVSSLKFDKPGYLAMANAGPNTNGSQFFITTAATPWLNGKHTIFGKVIKGMDVVDTIGKVKTKTGDRPIKDVVMEKVTVEKRKK
jgi:cyclophilin family peptidyl-prolyl cis-trans isomerase